jgi:hypothetical protein
VASPAKRAATEPPPRTRSLSMTNCPRGTFSCDWPRLSESIKDLKKLFHASPGKDKKG